jgi:integrase
VRKDAYWYKARPSDVAHNHPFLVFDCHGQLDLALTAIAKEAVAQLSLSTARIYLSGIMSFLTFLAKDEWQVRAGRKWDGPPEQVKQAVDDYLVQHLYCKVQDKGHYRLVSLTRDTRSTVRVFLSGLKFCYRAAWQLGYYKYAHPLIDVVSQVLIEVEYQHENEDGQPRMPQRSGVEKPLPKKRLTDSYYKLANEDWVPQTINDPLFPKQVLEGGRQLPGWGLREECVTRLLFETGARVSEIVGLTLADWLDRGGNLEANAFNKGSYGRRVKWIRFSKDMAKLLISYFDNERSKLDPHRYTLQDYRLLASRNEANLAMVPLFLSNRRTPWTAKTYRDNFWAPACKAARIDADIHQARHWYVTQAIDTIHQTSIGEGDFQRQVLELIEYMRWTSGEETMKAYLHLYDAAQHAAIQDRIHKKLNSSVQQSSASPQRVRLRKPASRLSSEGKEAPQATFPIDPAYEFLISLGGGNASN